MAEEAPPDEAGTDRHRRGLRFRKRDDHAIELFREAKAHLADINTITVILLELSRFYNPLIDGPIVDLGTRRKIVELLQAGESEHAGRLLDERLALYAGSGGEA